MKAMVQYNDLHRLKLCISDSDLLYKKS